MTRILITGSRHWTDRETVMAALVGEWSGPDGVLVSGACPTGADRMAEEMWEFLGGVVQRHPADWDRYGKKAGPIRNQEMVDLGADICLAFPLPDSRGTVDCVKRARAAGIPVRLIEPMAWWQRTEHTSAAADTP